MPQSECRGVQQMLQPLLTNQILARKRVAAGQRLVVVDRDAFARWVEAHYPKATDAPATGTSSRTQSVALYRSTKAQRSNLPEIISMRSFLDGGLIRDDFPVESTKASAENGVFSFVLGESHQFKLRGRCALIENPALFHAFEDLGLNVPLAIGYGGVCSNRLLSWLADSARNGAQVLHLPDYDPTGLAEFLRIHRRLGEAVQLHIPADLKAVFERYSDRSLLNKSRSQQQLLKLRDATHPAVRQIVAFIEEMNAGLEQEALLLNKCSAQ